jgi:hypothetical protein
MLSGRALGLRARHRLEENGAETALDFEEILVSVPQFSFENHECLAAQPLAPGIVSASAQAAGEVLSSAG